jgi:hypothetical protein
VVISDRQFHALSVFPSETTSSLIIELVWTQEPVWVSPFLSNHREAHSLVSIPYFVHNMCRVFHAAKMWIVVFFTGVGVVFVCKQEQLLPSGSPHFKLQISV